jgi:hypothetical protein
MRKLETGNMNTNNGYQRLYVGGTNRIMRSHDNFDNFDYDSQRDAKC